MPGPQGGCACGAVRFETRGAPYRVGLCHCLTCRKVHGAPFVALAIHPIEAVTVSGRTGTFMSSETGRRMFCRSCGSHVFAQDGGSDEIELSLGSFDEPNVLVPTYELFTSRREGWLGELPTVRVHHEGGRPGHRRREP